MTTIKLFLSVLLLIPACDAQATQALFACNLKAFQPQEKIRWRKLIERVTSAVDSLRELNDGYALRVDPKRISVVEVAEWIDLERKCCPFFDFQLALHGEDGTLWLSLTGRDGVKQFIEMDFGSLRDKLPRREGTK
jgi:hypothetical protein